MHFNLSNRVVVVGSSGSGKSQYILEILKNKNRMIDGDAKFIHYLTCKKEFVDDEVKNIPDTKVSECIDLDELGNNSIVVFDDLMVDDNIKNVVKLFIADARHRQIAPFFVLHNLYPNTPHARTITLNATHFIIFRNLRDRLQFAHFARQLTPNWKDLMNIYEDLGRKPFSPLVIDLDQTTPDAFRFKSDILNKDYFVIYSTKNDIEACAKDIFKVENESAYAVEYCKG